MGSTVRQENELKMKVREQLKKATDPVEKIRLTALARGAAGIKDIGRIFRNMDDDNSGKISFKEFQKGVSDIGCLLNKSEIETAFREFDSDNSGSISYDEFLLHLRGKIISPPREKLVLQAFQKLDKDNSGTITVEDLHDVYDVSKHPKIISGEWTDDQALQSFLAVFDTPDNADGTVTREEFLSYYAGVSASIDSDAYFVLMMENAWRLNEKKRKSAGPRSGSKAEMRGVFDKMGQKDERSNYSRTPTDLNCSKNVEMRSTGIYQR